MICALCGDTEDAVTMRSFAFAGQMAYLVVCDRCRDKANNQLAQRESRVCMRSVLDTDVKPEPGPKLPPGEFQARILRARARRAGKKQVQPIGLDRNRTKKNPLAGS